MYLLIITVSLSWPLPHRSVTSPQAQQQKLLASQPVQLISELKFNKLERPVRLRTGYLMSQGFKHRTRILLHLSSGRRVCNVPKLQCDVQAMTNHHYGSKCPGLESREYGRRDLSRWPCDTLNPQKLALTSLTSGGRSVRMGLSRTLATELSWIQMHF
jgi:hypothetical protein